MTGDRIAVIDLGSNTFHLLIGEVNADGSWIEIHKEKEFTKLASGGILTIDEDAEQRAIDSMMRFAREIEFYQVKKTKAIGTAALREAGNGKAVAEKLTSVTGIPIEIIDGKREARLIHLGIKTELPDLENTALIMDIGGGSVEFIGYDGDQIHYARSFKIGVAVLFEKFHHTDPINKSEIRALENFLERELSSLFQFLENRSTFSLIGASGSFEVLHAALLKRESHKHWAEMELEGCIKYMDRIIGTTLEERKKMPEIPVERLDYIVVAFLLISFLMEHFPPARFFYCDYALKEGMMAEMIRENF